MWIKRHWLWLCTALVVALLLIFGLWPESVLVETEEVTEGELSHTIVEEGKTRVTHRYIISSPVSAYMRRIELDVGDRVTQGEVVAWLEPLPADALDPRRQAEAKARVEAAKSALAAARQSKKAIAADAEFAQAELRRMERLAKENAVSQELYEQTRMLAERRRAELRSAQFSVEVAQHQVEAAETLLHYAGKANATTLTADQVLQLQSPINGVLLRLLKQSEGVVGAGERLLELGDPQDLEIAVDVLSSDAVHLAEGGEVRLQRWGGDILRGVVKRIEPVAFTHISALGVEEQRVNVLVSLLSDATAWQRLGDAYRVEAEFVVWQEPSVLRVPESAIFFRNGEHWVYVDEGGKARLRAISKSVSNGLYASVTEGLSAGEQVVVYPGSTVKDGVSIRHR